MRSRFRGQELKDDNLFGFVLPFLILVSKFEMFVLPFLILVSKFEMFVLPTFILRFKFLHICSIFPILVSIFERLVLNA